jgi:allose kinase
MTDNYIIGLDIGGTNIRIGAQKPGGELTGFKKLPSESILGNTDSVAKLADFILDYMKIEFPEKEIDAVAIGFPSTLSADRGFIYQTPNITGLDNISVIDILEEKLKTKILLEKDVNILFQWDVFTKSLPEEGIGIGIYIGTGIGNAISINGELLIGKDGVAGEIGHIPVIGGRSICRCGNQACAECYASGRHLIELRELCFKDTNIPDLFLKHKETKTLMEFVDAIACVVALEINILNPHYIILGGGVIAMRDFPKELLVDYIHSHTRQPFPRENLKIYFSEDSAKNGVLGAIYYAQKRIKQ